MELIFITKKRLIHCLVLILALMSIFRLVRISTLTTGTFSFPSTLMPLLPSVMLNNCSRFNSSSSSCGKHNYSTSKSLPNFNSSSTRTGPNIPILTHKEYKFLNNLIRKKSPCNLLIFGLGPQYLHLINAAGAGSTAIILEDNPENIRLFKRSTISLLNHNTTFIYRVSYELRAKDAFESLQQVRKTPSCSSPRLDTLENPWSKTCRLGLTGLPREVINGIKWDVIVVDGPSSDGLEAAGRMSSIYTAGVLARRSGTTSGSVTNVVVHDVDRTIEKWFAWEFLCDENLVSVKGKLWNFEIRSGGGDERVVNSTGFCERK